MPLALLSVLLLGSGVPAKNSIDITATPYGYVKWWATHDRDANHATINAVRPGILLSYRDWKFIWLHDLYPGDPKAGEQLLDAWFLYTPKGKALQRLEFGQIHLPSGWEARTSSSFIHTMRRTMVISKLAQSSYDTGIWSEWNTPWRKGYWGVGVVNGAGLNHSDPDSDKDYIVGASYPIGPFTLEATRYWGGGVHNMHYTEAMVQWLKNDWMFYGEYWSGARDGNHYDGGYALLRKHLGGNFWTTNRWERLNSRATGDPAATETSLDRWSLCFSYETQKGWRALVDYDIYSGDNAPKDCLGFELQWRWYPWTQKAPIQPQKPKGK